MPRHAQSLIVAVFPLVLSSCVFSQHPLSDESTSTLDRRLIGTWTPVEGGKVSPTGMMTLGRKPGTRNTLEAVGLALNRDNTVKVKRETWYTRTGKVNYLSWEFRNNESGKAYLLCRYDVPKPRTFRIFFLDKDFIGAAVEKGELKGKVQYADAAEPVIANEKVELKSDDKDSKTINLVYLTDSPKNILEFLNAHVSESFEKEPKVYRKTSK